MKHYKKVDLSLKNNCGYESRKGQKADWITIHYTANKNDKAESNVKYFIKIWEEIKRGYGNRYASAHYVVDATTCFKAVQVKYAAWHCGDAKYKYSTGGSMYGKVTNYNSIGIEMCNCLDKLDTKVLENTICLVKDLCKKYNIPLDHIVRHYDVSGKHCPARMIDDTEEFKNNWLLFKKAVATGDKKRTKIDKDGNLYFAPKGSTNWKKVGTFTL